MQWKTRRKNVRRGKNRRPCLIAEVVIAASSIKNFLKTRRKLKIKNFLVLWLANFIIRVNNKFLTILAIFKIFRNNLNTTNYQILSICRLSCSFDVLLLKICTILSENLLENSEIVSANDPLSELKMHYVHTQIMNKFTK